MHSLLKGHYEDQVQKWRKYHQSPIINRKADSNDKKDPNRALPELSSYQNANDLSKSPPSKKIAYFSTPLFG